MNYNRLVYFLIVLNIIVLSGCSRTSEMVKLSSEIQDLNKKIDQMNEDFDTFRSDLEHVTKESNRANKRLDNQVSFYRK